MRDLVEAHVVRGLVTAFLQSPKFRRGTCSTWADVAPKLQAAFNALPELQPGFVDFHDATRALLQYECHKLSAHCNSWTPWMQHQLRAAKVRG